MTIELFAHPFSSYCQKAITAFYENGIPFALRMLEPGNAAQAELAAIWPIGKFPVLREGGRVVPEATSIVEYLHIHHRGPVPLIPDDPDAALEVRTLDRFFDNYVATPQQRIVFDHMRAEADRDPIAVKDARAALDKAYAWLDAHMADREWAAGDFSLADVSAGPQLFYADWSHPMDGRFPNVAAYRARLMARSAFARAIDEARPWRAYFPGGAPDRD
ncbi:glutathione S-transferase family protein [Allosphingosinicella indica]|uniref:Glutathione S-transferase n=1 Tax=Allosphingosinicella indica TaxID=941907 RepID=A0A1X7G7C8_9SPHN|nr:glutathione S-transferase family protein [Allosphingosinicella indica]SMF65315.1 glutathione S-transferase [Allosphingosinicella indica]